MKLVFAHDHIFKKDINNNLYTGGSFNNDVWLRYLRHFEQVEVLARLEEVQDSALENFNKFNLKNTSLTAVPYINTPLKKIKNQKKAEEIIRNSLQNSDALIARLPSEIGNLSIKIAKEIGKPYAVEVVACVWDALYNHGNVIAKAYAPYAMFKMKRNVKQAPRSLYVTRDFLQKRYPTDGISTNVSNVELEKVKSLSAINNKSKEKNNIKIGMIGSINNNIKGWTVAFEALKILKENNIKFDFYALGDGSPSKWDNLLDDYNLIDNVHFEGVLPGGEPILNWMDKLDIYIQPSFQEGLPRAVIEAMSRGLPIVGSNAGGIPELIDKKLIHKKGNSKQLAEKIKYIITDLQDREQQKLINLKNSREYLKDKLDTKRELFWNEFKNEL